MASEFFCSSMTSSIDAGVGLENIASISMSITSSEHLEEVGKEEIVHSCSSSESNGLNVKVSVSPPDLNAMVFEKTSIRTLAVFKWSS